MAWAKREASTTTKHNHVSNFGKKVDGCPRCEELRAGAKAVTWNVKSQDAQRSEWVRNHNCKTAGCGIVCTYGDW